MRKPRAFSSDWTSGMDFGEADAAVLSRRVLHSAHEVEAGRARAHANGVAGPEVAPQDALSEWVLELLLDRPLERPRAVDRVEPSLGKPIARRRLEHEPDVAIGEPSVQVRELNVDDLADVLRLERMEHDHVVDPVDELRPEMLADDVHHLRLHPLVVLRTRELLDSLAAEVRSHHDH